MREALEEYLSVVLRRFKAITKNSRWSDAFLGGAQVLACGSRSALFFSQLVHDLMVVEHQMGAIGHQDSRRPIRVVDIDSLLDEVVKLLEKSRNLIAGSQEEGGRQQWVCHTWMTTPLPMMHVVLGCTRPDGSKWNLKVLPSTTMVWPALFPPAQRAMMSY